MEIVKAGKWRVALIILVFLSAGYGVSAYLNHTSILQYDSFIANQWANATNISASTEFYRGGTSLTDLLAGIAGGTGVNVTESSYIVYKDGSTYYAQNGFTGLVDYSGANATTVIQAAINALTGGSIFIKAGLYTIYTPIYLKSNINYVGEGYETHFKLADGRPNAVAGDWLYWCIFLAGSNLENFTIKNMRLDGNYAGNQDLGAITHGCSNAWLSGVRNGLIERVWSSDHRMGGMDIVAWGRDVYGITVKDSYFFDNKWNGFSIGAGDHDVYDCLVDNNEFGGTIGDIALCVTGASATETAERITLSNNRIREMTGTLGSSGDVWYGIKLEYYTKYIEVINNIIKNVRMGVAEAGTSYGSHRIIKNIVLLKDVSSGVDPRGIDLVHTHSTVAFNTVYAPPTDNCFGIRSVADGVNDNKYILVLGNELINEGTGWMNAIRDTGGDYNEYLYNNVIRSNGKIDLSGVGSHTVLRDNLGFVTKNSGTATGTGAQQNVPHGLAATPTIVILGEYNTSLAIPYQSAAADATNLKVTAVNGKTFTWYASVYP